jgi:hypothetical protein
MVNKTFDQENCQFCDFCLRPMPNEWSKYKIYKLREFIKRTQYFELIRQLNNRFNQK